MASPLRAVAGRSAGFWTRRGRARPLTALVAVSLVMSVFLASPARAFIFVVPAPSFPDTVPVGQTFPATVGIGNFSTPPESVTFPTLAISQINLVPACSVAALDCPGGAEAGVFALSPTGVGTGGGQGCLGTWTITELTPAHAVRARR